MSITFADRDEFNRKTIAENMIKLLQSETDVSPMMLDGSWGTGKTEFCLKTLELFSQKDTHQLIYIDAFKADHADEPLLTLLAEVLKLIPEEEGQRSFIKKVIPAARYSVKTLMKAGIGHVLRQDFADTANDFDKEIQKAADKAIDSSVESMLKDHAKAGKNLESLQVALKELADIKPIIIFIDELDRCRPDFAVSMLELIKHVFDVDGVQFVLVTNSQQLKASINHCYGISVKAQRYLDKFLKFSFQISNKSTRQQNNPAFASITLYKQLVQNEPSLSRCEIERGYSLKLIENFILNHRISLREVETLVRHLSILQVLTEKSAFSPGQFLGYTLLHLLSVLIHCFKPDLVTSINHGNYDAKLIGELLSLEVVKPFPDVMNRPEIEEVLMVILARDCKLGSEPYLPKDDIDKWDNIIEKGFFNYGLDSGDAINELKNTFEALSLTNNLQ
jgi:hypothetical protein